MAHESARYRKVLRAALIFSLSLVASAAVFQPSRLVLDINRVATPVGSHPSLVCDAPGFTLLVSAVENESYRLWRTDGSDSGTVQIGRIDSVLQNSGFECLHAEAPGPVFFQYTDDDGNPELWRSDGTAAGTYRLLHQSADMGPIRALGAVGLPLFAAAVGNAGLELVRSDGTVAGTQVVADLTPGPDQSWFGPHSLVLNGRLLFELNGDLWSSDGTASGTQLVLDLAPDDDFADFWGMEKFGNRVLLSVPRVNSDPELWISDGTPAGSTLLRSFSGSLSVSGATSASSTRAIFAVTDSSYTTTLWRTDGTMGGTQPLQTPEPDLTLNSYQGWKVPTGVVFLATTPAHGEEPWFSDGTDAGTYQLHEHGPGTDFSYVNDFYPVPGGLLYSVFNSTRGLWFTDGTPAGTWSVLDQNPQFGSDWVYGLATLAGNDVLIWSKASNSLSVPDRYTMWRVSLTARTLTRVQDYMLYGLGSASALRSGRVLFSFDLPPFGMEPWISDGTLTGTHLLHDLAPQLQNGHGFPSQGFNIGATAYMAADDGINGVSLWKSDGTAAGTQRVAGAAPEFSQIGLPHAPLGSTVVYSGRTNTGMTELWRTDGTTAGTVLVKDLSGVRPGASMAESSYPGSCGAGMLTMNGNVYYGAAPLGVGKLFRTDGTAAGTVELGSFPSTAHVFQPSSRVCLLGQQAGSVYFEATEPVDNELRLWRSNGQPGDSVQVRNDNGGTVSPPLNMVEWNGALYFFSYSQGQVALWRLVAGDPVAHLVLPRTWSNDNGYPIIAAVLGNTLIFQDGDIVNGSQNVSRMYRTDGTAAGTALLSTGTGYTQFRPRHGTRLGNRFLYTTASDDTGVNLWFTDGTTAGTSTLRIVMAGYQQYDRPEFVNFNGLAYFALNRISGSTTVSEIWRTDGTATGTERANQIPHAFRLGNGRDFAVSGQRLLFTGTSDVEGVELWSIENEAPLVQADAASTTSPNTVTIDVLANDSDPDGTLVRSSLRITGAATSGTAALEGTSIRYTPAAGFSGTDTFTYAVSDTQGRESLPGTATVTVAAAPSGGGGGAGSGGGGNAGGGSGTSGGGGATGWLALFALASLLGSRRPGRTARRC